MSYTKYVLCLMLPLVLWGCDEWQKQEAPIANPFVSVLPDQIITLDGKLYPFSASIATSATHRIEKNGKLVAYVTSPLVDLKQFEGEYIEVDGIWQEDNLREVFWAKTAKLFESAVAVEEPKVKRFTGSDFSFTYPAAWQVTETAEGQIALIGDGGLGTDPTLMLTSSPFSSEETRLNQNITINGLAGTRTTKVDAAGRDQETITFYSADGSKKYEFESVYFFDDINKRQSVMSVIKTFVVGADEISKALSAERQVRLDAEAERLAESAERERENEEKKQAQLAANEEEVEASESIVDKILESGGEIKDLIEEQFEATEEEPEATEADTDPDKEAPETEEEEIEDEPEPVVINPEDLVLGEFENQINDQAYKYSNEYFDVRMEIPYPWWYFGFGATVGNIIEVGVSADKIVERPDAEISIKVQKNGADITKPSEKLRGDQIRIWKPDGDRLYRADGPAEHRDLMWSIVETIRRY